MIIPHHNPLPGGEGEGEGEKARGKRFEPERRTDTQVSPYIEPETMGAASGALQKPETGLHLKLET
jgi:hypothetical protein